MRANTASKYAIFLVLLVLGQELCVAHNEFLRRSFYLEKRSIKKREVSEVTEDIKEIAVKENKESEAKSRQKRAYAIVLLAITLAVSGATVGFEIYLKIRGCCGANIYPKTCFYAKELDRLMKLWKTKLKQVDALFLKVDNLRVDIIGHSSKIQEMFQDLNGLGKNYETLVKKLSPGTAGKFQKKWKEIEDELKRGNRTVAGMDYNGINLQFKSYFDNPHATMAGLSTFLSNVASLVYTTASRYYMRNYQNKMINRLGTGKSYRMLVKAKHSKAAMRMGLNDVSINAYVKDTVKGKVQSKFGFKSRSFAALYHTYNAVGTLMSLGSDAYRIYQNVKYCKDKRDKILPVYNDWFEADRRITKLIVDLQKYYNTVNKGWKKIRDILCDPELLKTLGNVNKILKKISPKSQRVQKSIRYVTTYIAHIKKAKRDLAYKMEMDLIYGLMTANMLMECMTKRAEFVEHVSRQCKIGRFSLVAIWRRDMPLFKPGRTNCNVVSVKEVPFGDVLKFIADRAKKEKYNADCFRNDKYKQLEVCSLNNRGHKIQKIKKKLGITLSQTQYFLAKCRPKLSPNQEKSICNLRRYGFTNKWIKAFVYKNKSLAVIVAVTC